VAYVNAASPDVIPVIQNTVVTILQRVEHLLQIHNQIVGVDDRNNWNELQGNLCNVVTVSASSIYSHTHSNNGLQHVTRKLGSGIQPLGDRIMTLILQLIQSAGRTSTVLEDAFLAVGALCGALDTNFAPYIPPFLPFLYTALKAHEDAQLCTVAVGLIGDISRALQEQSAQYANSFMTVLLEGLQSEVLNRNVKISILATFGDVALAIGPAFEPYLQTTMNVLHQAGSVEPNPVCGCELRVWYCELTKFGGLAGLRSCGLRCPAPRRYPRGVHRYRHGLQEDRSWYVPSLLPSHHTFLTHPLPVSQRTS
jgi:importin subunit beta-1